MNVLMFGWEFPPHISGGLGTACYGLTRGLADAGVEVVYVLPHGPAAEVSPCVTVIDASCIAEGKEASEVPAPLRLAPVDTLLSPYMDDDEYETVLAAGTPEISVRRHYAGDLLSEVVRYGVAAAALAEVQSFDVIHGHDWMTIPASLEAKRISGRPLVLHIHSLESDRSGMRIDERMYGIERLGMMEADHIIAVSHYTKDKIVAEYGISDEKISIVHNAVARADFPGRQIVPKASSDKTVLFLGRMTAQKGPDLFLRAAKKILENRSDVHFIMAGSGSMMQPLVEEVTALKLERYVTFTGFLRGAEVEAAYAACDLYVMPSVSDPFGITALEAIACDVPVVISARAGVGEILPGCPKVDCTDTDLLAKTILEVLDSEVLAREIAVSGARSIARLTWRHAAEKVIGIYNRVIL